MFNEFSAIRQLLKILAIHILLVISWFVLVDLIFELRNFESSVERGFKNSLVSYVLFALVIGPLWEEFVFRWPLVRKKKIWGAVLLGIVFLLSFKFLILKILTVIYIVFLCLHRIKENYILKYITIGMSILVFGLMHIENYSFNDVEAMNIFEFFSTFFSQLFLGALLTYIRLRFSFLYGVIYHMVFNGILLCLGLILI
ncbi:CPBP family glutamic-type intramembrane protease [Sphingobacterium sp. UT-1RO-CII-1]|uniref:CPBP family glutamic-type intramembrane protease n=1 Tax=Sphingobacterium sp. UT-1RO-CII-1 TaxID=2995225 RepID=UPI003FA3CE36